MARISQAECLCLLLIAKSAAPSPSPSLCHPFPYLCPFPCLYRHVLPANKNYLSQLFILHIPCAQFEILTPLRRPQVPSLRSLVSLETKYIKIFNRNEYSYMNLLKIQRIFDGK